MKTNLAILGAAIRELADSPLVLLHPASRTLLEAVRAIYSDLLAIHEQIDKLKGG